MLDGAFALCDLVERIRTSMPQDKPGMLQAIRIRANKPNQSAPVINRWCRYGK